MKYQENETIFEFSSNKPKDPQIQYEKAFVPASELMFRGYNDRNTYSEKDIRVGRRDGERGYYNR